MACYVALSLLCHAVLCCAIQLFWTVQCHASKILAVKTCMCCCHSDLFLKQEKTCILYNNKVGTKGFSLQRQSLPSLTLRLSQPSTPIRYSCCLLLLMDCLHACLILTVFLRAEGGISYQTRSESGHGACIYSLILARAWSLL
jgi:hypothetical protein